MVGDQPMAVTVRIGECSEEDLQVIHKILGESPGAAQWSGRALKESLTSAENKFLVARVKGEIAGLIAGRVVGDEAEILNVAVKGNFRRLGIGKSLVAAMWKHYEEARIRTVFLEVRESNQGAIAFYKGLGFKQVGMRPDYYRDPVESALILAREACGEG